MQDANNTVYSIYQRCLFNLFYLLTHSKSVTRIKQNGRIIAIIHDIFAVQIAWLLSYLILINAMENMLVYNPPAENSSLFGFIYWKYIFLNLLWVAPLQFLLFKLFGLYRGFWRFASIQDLRKIMLASLFGSIIIWIVLKANHPTHTPFSDDIIALLYFIFILGFLSFARLIVRLLKDYRLHYGKVQKVIIIGAGNAGESLVRNLLRDKNHSYLPVAFVDDDLSKLGRDIHNIRVVGTITKLPTLVIQYGIDLALIAIPSASSASMRSIADACEKSNIPYYTLPGVKDLAKGYISNTFRNVSLEDLLGRYPVSYQLDAIKPYLKNKIILITGGGGSIGSELCRQIMLTDIERLIILDNNEYNLYAIDMELKHRYPLCKIDSVLQSVTDRTGIKNILKKYQPHIVFHAAAYKHVPLLEYQPRVAIYNNVIGTAVIAEESSLSEVEIFVFISSDKAVNPTNIMGATKRASEYFCQYLNNAQQKTKFITVRFGNVLDSVGSVIPLFRKQIEQGGPVTVTHPEITRFFMTIPEAIQLILQAAFMGKGGEIFVLDMGDPIKIRYLAEKMIKLSGKWPDKDIKIIYTGLRPGEKLYEEWFYPNEILQPTLHNKIMIAKSEKQNLIEVKKICSRIENIYANFKNNESDLMELFKYLVPEYSSKKPNDTKNHHQVMLEVDKAPR